MSHISVLGAGAFGTSLAIALSRSGQPVTLWARDQSSAEAMQRDRVSGQRLPGFELPPSLTVTQNLRSTEGSAALLAVPMASLTDLLSMEELPDFPCLVACMKGIEPNTGKTPSEMIGYARPGARVAALTGPSFAVDIAAGLPTALALACHDDVVGARLQAQLSTAALRLYRTTDLTGAELGGALKNVVAIAAGVAIGAGLGESARASIISRGLSEMTRLAQAMGARPETLRGLSGLGDLVLTATSKKSRNYQAGLALGTGKELPLTTTEGVATARATTRLASNHGVEAPIASAIGRLVQGEASVNDAIATLLSRPLRKE